MMHPVNKQLPFDCSRPLVPPHALHPRRSLSSSVTHSSSSPSVNTALTSPSPSPSSSLSSRSSASLKTAPHDPLSLSPSSRDRRLRQILEEHRADRARITQRTRSVYEVGRHHQTSEDKLDAAISELCRIEREFQSFQHVAKARQELLKRENECYRQRLIALGEDLSGNGQNYLSPPRYERTVSAVGLKPRTRHAATATAARASCDFEVDNGREGVAHYEGTTQCCHDGAAVEKEERRAVADESKRKADNEGKDDNNGEDEMAVRKERDARRSEVRRRAHSKYRLGLNDNRSKMQHLRNSQTEKVNAGSLCDPNAALLKPTERELKLDQLVDVRVEAELAVDRARKQRSGSIRAGLKWLDANARCNSPAAQHSSWRTVSNRLAFAAMRPSIDKENSSEQRRSARLPKSLSRKWTTCF